MRGLLAAFCFSASLGLAALHGTVTDASTGRPLAQATVSLHSGIDVIDEAVTNERGEFRFAPSRKGTFRVVATKDAYTDTVSSLGRLNVQVADRDVELAFTLVKAAVVTGRVTDAAGKPVRLARVVPIVRGSRYTAGQPQARPDDRGVYRLYGLVPGRYLIAVVPDFTGRTGFQSQGHAFLPVFHPGVTDPDRGRWIVLKPGETRSTVDFILSATGAFAVDGVVTGAEGLDKTRIGISLIPATGYADNLQTVAAGADGHFHFDAVPSGSYQLIAGAPVRGYAFFGPVLGDTPRYGRQRVDVGGQALSGVTIALEPAVTFQGRLAFAKDETPDPSCFAGAVQLQPLDAVHGPPGLSARVAGDGSFTQKDLQPGRYRLVPQLKAGCFGAGVEPVVTVNASTRPITVPISAKGGSVAGKAPAGSVVILARAGEDLLPVSVQAGADGSYRFDPVGPGSYRLMAVPALDNNHHLDPLFWSDHKSQVVEVKVAAGATAAADLHLLKLRDDWQ